MLAGIAGAAIIDERISADTWPNESIIIAGVHGITKPEYKELCDVLDAQFSQSNAPDSVPDGQWVNCCVIWIKDRNDSLQKWVQPKIRPAWLEMNVACNDMFCGSNMYVFEGRYETYDSPCRFISFVCFDWVASVAGTTVCDEILTKLNQLWTESQPALDWIFVVQHNTEPNHSSFLNSTFQFLTNVTYACVQRDKAIVLHVNTAVRSPFVSVKQSTSSNNLPAMA